MTPSMILRNGRITTLDRAKPTASAVAIADGLIAAAGEERDILPLAGPQTQVIDLGGRTVIPGLIDSHTHLIRGGLNYNMELRWDGVPSVADALRMLKEQAQRTPAPQWVRVVGGFAEFQFAERRLPTLDEVNAAAPDTPVFILHLYDRALLNKAAVRAVGYTKNTPNPPGGVIERDGNGEPTGLLVAKPNALILYATLAAGPKLSPDDQINSSRHFMRELNRLGITSVIDAGGGYQNYPDDYHIIEKLHRDGQLTVRVAYNLFTQKPKEELADFKRWTQMVKPGQGSAMYRHNGAGEMLAFTAADFEDFREPRPDLPAAMEGDLEPVVRVAYNLFTQKPKEELADFKRWTQMVKPGQGSAMYRHNGAGEMLAFTAADFEDFREPRPDLPAAMEGDLEPVVRVLTENRWPFRLHATYDETISRALDVFEKVNRDVPLTGLHWFIDHAETITPRSMDRLKALGGGIAIQHRMAFQGEYFVSRYGAKAGEVAPPIKEMLSRQIPVGAGTDATRVASYNPWIALSWLTTGKTVGGLRLYPPERRLDRTDALRLWTQGSAWFSTEQDKKGTIAPGQYADLAVLSDDYFSVPEDRISRITAVMTIVGGKVVHGADTFRDLAPPLPPVSPDWAPVRHYGGYQHAVVPAPTQAARACHDGCAHHCAVHAHDHARAWAARVPAANATAFWGALGCSCFL